LHHSARAGCCECAGAVLLEWCWGFVSLIAEHETASQARRAPREPQTRTAPNARPRTRSSYRSAMIDTAQGVTSAKPQPDSAAAASACTRHTRAGAIWTGSAAHVHKDTLTERVSHSQLSGALREKALRSGTCPKVVDRPKPALNTAHDSVPTRSRLFSASQTGSYASTGCKHGG